MEQVDIDRLVGYINRGMACPPGLKPQQKGCRKGFGASCVSCILAHVKRQEKLPEPF
jgi:hypothetical protein